MKNFFENNISQVYYSRINGHISFQNICQRYQGKVWDGSVDAYFLVEI